MGRTTKNPGGLHPEDIKAFIRKRGVTLTRLSLDNGLPEYACRQALSRPDFDAELVIAEFLGLSPRQIWPNRFDPDGTRRHRLRRRNSRPLHTPGHRQNQERA